MFKLDRFAAFELKQTGGKVLTAHVDRSRLRPKILAAAILLVMAGANVTAQTGNIAGTITDATGGGVP